MEKSLIISNLDPFTTENEIRREIGGPVPILSIYPIVDTFMNTEYFFPLFIIQTTQEGVMQALSGESIYKIRGKILQFTQTEQFIQNNCGIVLFGETKYTTCEDVLHTLIDCEIDTVEHIQTTYGKLFFINLKKKDMIDAFLLEKPCCEINSRLYYSHKFPILPQNHVDNFEESIRVDNIINKTITLVHNHQEYTVPYYIAASCSELIQDEIKLDVNVSKIDVENIEGPFASVVDILSGKSVQINENPVFFFQMGVCLGIQSLIDATESYFYNTLTTTIIIPAIKLGLKFKRGIQTLLRYVRTHYDELSSNEEFKSFEPELLQYARIEEEQRQFMTKEQFDSVITDTSIDLNAQREKLKRLITSGI
ncbi:hypothetical protein TVAG_057460 [Trichomonas vaginalis G3]|uniref:Uncharacterized protein n=1 Tax=Trichomonas vaginalis (strain ATCC PRA-98 / G3) TaxID=412133 RepID=A2F8M4_TRIV3|nr:hypothetical protein TVAGG3_0084410 [Trichomonas vaginalis G3]EAX98756.1 hypothetical protein TVAG_057460 [Trichomonas vaginalis G3]KAI5543494.1 hypothetical protein TVAGG3_0084410 [Trichomonas vaginalis G3]|eukprot:XP_001311686.1 hypothetical protein [Trichomonas vaginalis G3]